MNWSLTSVLLTLTLVGTTILNCLTLFDGHNWGGDFAQYILHAQNLINGRPYTSGIMIEHVIIYPPGFPLLIAPLIKTFGMNTILLKSLNIFCWVGTVVLLFELALTYTNRFNALLCSLLVATSSVLFVFKQNILSDMPFMFVVTAALLAFRRGGIILGIILLYVSILLRSSGLVLSVSLLFFYLFVKRDRRTSAWIAISSLAAFITQAIITQGLHPAFFTAFLQAPEHFFKSLINYASTPWQSVAWFLVPGQTPLTSSLFFILSCLATILAPLLWLGVFFYGAKRFLSRQLTLIDTFCFFYSLMLLFWSSFGDSPQQFERFLFPLIGLIPLLFFQNNLPRRGLNTLVIACILFISMNIINTAAMFRYNDDEIVHHQENQELFDWMKTATGPDDHFMYWEPRPITLMTGRVGTTSAWVAFNKPEQWAGIMREHHVRYLICSKNTDQNMIGVISTKSDWMFLAWQNNNYVVFKVKN